MEKPRDLYSADTAPASGTVKKVIEINPYLLGTMAGGAGRYFSCLSWAFRVSI